MARKVDEATNFAFVKLIEQQPGLYDKRHPDHARRDKMDLAWGRISREMNESVRACKDRWKHIRTVFVRHLHAETPSGSSATKMRPYYLHDAMQFMIPHITMSTRRESNLQVPCAQEVSQMNETPRDSVSIDRARPAECTTVLQQASSSRQSSDHQQRFLSKRQRLNDLNPVDTCVMGYRTQETQPITPDPDAEFFRSLLPDIKTMNAKQKRVFKIGVVKLIDDILDNTESNGQSSINLAETSTVQSLSKGASKGGGCQPAASPYPSKTEI